MPEDGLHPVRSTRPYRADAERSYVLAPNYYTDPAIWEREKQAIFYKTWNFAGHEGQLAKAGDYVTCRIADQEIFVIRGKDGPGQRVDTVGGQKLRQLVRLLLGKKFLTG